MIYTELSQLPEKEAAVWEAAHVVGDDRGRRQVTRRYAGSIGTGLATIEQFLEEVTDRLARWRDGQYPIIEAAQILADSNPGIDAVRTCEQMEQAAHDGNLIIRENGIPLNPAELKSRRIYNRQVRQNDVNNWLHSIGAGFELHYPYAENDAAPIPAPQTAPANKSVTAAAALPVPPSESCKLLKHKIVSREMSILTAEIVKAKENAPDANSVASVWDELTKLAENAFGVMIGFSSDGIQYRGRKYQATQEPDVFTRRNLRERMTREAVERRVEPH